MRIKWNGHASFTITASDGTVLVTDPYDPGGYGGVLRYDTVSDRADAVLISHDHADHNYVQGLSGSPQVLKVDGINVCFAGDLGHQLSADQIEAIGSVDLLLIPVGGTFTVDAKGAAKVVEALGPKIVIPMHFKTDKCDLPIGEVDDFLAQMANAKRVRQSEVELSPDTLPSAGTEVWVLDYAC